MQTRRTFVKNIFAKLSLLSFCGLALSACGRDEDFASPLSNLDDDSPVGYIDFYPTYIRALYFDGSEGPNTGIVYPEDLIAGIRKEYDFWHGHGGVLHKFVLEESHFKSLKRLEINTITSSTVARHEHKMLIDPTAERLRVPDTQPMRVPIYQDDLDSESI